MSSAAESDVALVFVAAQFALDSNMGTLDESGGELSKLPEGDASMPLGPRFPRPGFTLPRRLEWARLPRPGVAFLGNGTGEPEPETGP